ASPFFIILYADKTRLSLFGTEKGYPILARGGCLIGWLPIAQEDAGNTGKKDFMNAKRTVWHTAFYEIVKSIEQYTESGTTVICGDKIERQIFPRVLFLSANYEEQ
ncbi:hypothetical protein HYPSUDRAFT_119953, partial [Hypholoma sublateritium FD-334 SS-4]